MVKIRLTRRGKKGQPHYRIIAISARTKREGEALEYLGYLNPQTKPPTIKLEEDRIKYWLSQGAQPTDSVKNILIRNKLIKADKQKSSFVKKAGRKAQERIDKKAASKAEAKKPAQKEEVKEVAAAEKTTETQA